MARVNILDISVSNKIAAGEVVERPAAVVKELVENSIDANAKNIIIEITGSGTELIRISDDGDGIHRDDIEKIFLPHATSKIVSEDDLYNINTLGFRGEALPSIAGVSKVNLKSKSKEFSYGMSIEIHGGTVINKTECACNIGTEIEVKEIFYNTPVRYKFLKSESRELAIIKEVVTRLAISNFTISFEYIVNGKNVFKTNGDSLRSAIISIFGAKTLENLVFVENYCENMNIYGYIGNINFCKSSRNNQYFFVNNRIVKNKNLIFSIENAYKNYLIANKFPFFILFLNLNPKVIDVNVHPTKSEIKFENEKMVYDFLYKTCTEELNSYLSNSTFTENDTLDSTLGKNNSTHYIQEEISPFTKEDIQRFIVNKKDKKELDKQIALEQKIYNIVTENEFDKECLNLEKNEEKQDSKGVENSEEINLESFYDFKVIGQYNNTYILGEWCNNLYIIDQHVAHEKILFEEFTNRIKNNIVSRQLLLMPIIINLDQIEYSTYKNNTNCFEKCGFTIENFGDNSIVIREVPYEFKDCEIKSLILDIIQNIENFGSGTLEEVKYDLIATKSCKSAVKANCKLNSTEIKLLVSKLLKLENPFTCPHGRPIIIKFSLYEVEKMFKRV